MKDNMIKNAYTFAFDISDKNLKDLIIINTKCLVDDSKQRYVYLDNNRLKDELIYFRFYGEKIEYNNILNIILPLILSNTNIKKSEDEAIALIQKYTKYLKKENKTFDYILGAVLYNTIIHKLIENKSIEYSELLQSMKERIIEFQLELDKISTIKFQMERIKIIQEIDKYIDLNVGDYDDDEKIASSLLNVLYDIYIENREVNNDGIKSIKKSILSILGENSNEDIDNIDFILSMSEYICKLRNYKINKKMYDKSADPLSLINLNEGDKVIDPILNQITVISKEFKNNILKLDVRSKSGTYSLKFKKS